MKYIVAVIGWMMYIGFVVMVVDAHPGEIGKIVQMAIAGALLVGVFSYYVLFCEIHTGYDVLREIQDSQIRTEE